MKRLCFSVALLTLLFSMSAMAQNQTRAIPIQTPGYFYVEPDNVAQDSQNASISLTINNSTLSATYKEGLQVVFKTEVLNGNNNNVQIQIIKRNTSLGVKNLLSRDGQEFGVGELDAGIMITATYDGTNFISDYRRPRQFRYIEPTNLTLTGNAYAITNTIPSIPPIGSASMLLGIKAEGTNTGNVTLSIDGGIDYPVFLSNGEQIPAGALLEGEFIFCIFTTTPNVGFRAINLRPARSLKGQLLATLDLANGTYSPSDANRFFGGWNLQSGVTAVEVIDYPVFAPYRVDTPITDGLVLFSANQLDTQLGWYIEIMNGANVVYSRLLQFGESGFSIQNIPTDNDNISFGMWLLRAGILPNADRISLALTPNQDFTLNATHDYTINIYISEN